ncbi:MAG: hypothetical protein ABJE95_13590 [Byssovorax sp.]
MRPTAAFLATTGTLFLAGCSLLIDASLDGKGTTSGSGGQGGSDMTSSAGSTSAGSTTAATSAQSASASVGASTSASSGGGCGPMCMLPNAMTQCIDGACAIKMCKDHFGDCNTLPGDGCEASFENDAANCNGCKKACMSGETCKGGKCN